MDKLIITKWQESLLTLHLREGKPYRLHLEGQGDGPGIGDVYRARVQHVNPGLKNAFLELGEGRRAYMNLTEENRDLRPGQEITVLINQEGVGEKLPTATMNLAFPGEWLVLSSDPGFLGFSRRAGFDGPQREAIHQMLEPYFGQWGFILRTAAEQVSLDLIGREAAILTKEYAQLVQRAEHSPAPLLISRGQPLYREWAQGLDKAEAELITDDPAVFGDLENYYIERGLSREKLRLYRDEELSLGSLYSLEKVLKEARDKRVWLRSGAYLVIEHTEALTVIDVNSGKNESAGKQTVEKINQEAAREVVRQLTLRNISGMILVDFINMKRLEAGEELIALLSQLVREDPVLTQVVDMTGLGLVEITRRRIRRPLQL